jgi:hypothetical protein
LQDNEIRDDADERLSALLRVHGLRGEVAAEAKRLLRVLLLRFGAMPPDANRAFQQDWRCLVLCPLRISTNSLAQDWGYTGRCRQASACYSRVE